MARVWTWSGTMVLAAALGAACGNKGGDTDAVALYDLAKDISEQNNLAATQPERVSKMRTAFEQWREVVKRFNDSEQTEPSAAKKGKPKGSCVNY